MRRNDDERRPAGGDTAENHELIFALLTRPWCRIERQFELYVSGSWLWKLAPREASDGSVFN